MTRAATAFHDDGVSSVPMLTAASAFLALDASDTPLDVHRNDTQQLVNYRPEKRTPIYFSTLNIYSSIVLPEETEILTSLQILSSVTEAQHRLIADLTTTHISQQSLVPYHDLDLTGHFGLSTRVSMTALCHCYARSAPHLTGTALLDLDFSTGNGRFADIQLSSPNTRIVGTMQFDFNLDQNRFTAVHGQADLIFEDGEAINFNAKAAGAINAVDPALATGHFTAMAADSQNWIIGRFEANGID